MSTQNDTPTPQWAVEAAKEIYPNYIFSFGIATEDQKLAELSAIITRHAPKAGKSRMRLREENRQLRERASAVEGLLRTHCMADQPTGVEVNGRPIQPAATGTPSVEKLLEATTIDLQNALIDRAVLQVDKNRLERELAEATNAASVRSDEAAGLAGQLAEARAEAERLQKQHDLIKPALLPDNVPVSYMELCAELTALRGLLGDALVQLEYGTTIFSAASLPSGSFEAVASAIRARLATERKEDKS